MVLCCKYKEGENMTNEVAYLFMFITVSIMAVLQWILLINCMNVNRDLGIENKKIQELFEVLHNKYTEAMKE